MNHGKCGRSEILRPSRPSATDAMRMVTCLVLAATSANALHTKYQPIPRTPTPLHSLRGGAGPLATPGPLSIVTASLSGSLAVPAAAGIAAIAGSLAYIHQAYAFSLSYGLAMLGIGGFVWLAALPSARLVRAHAALVAVYGARLFAFLLWRQRFQPGYDGTARLRALDTTPPLARTPLIASTALFYSLLASPLLFHLAAPPLAGRAATVSGVGLWLAALGVAGEALADLQKSLFKMRLRAEGRADAPCTAGLFSRSRHANYLGELAFWLGSFVAGAPALGAAGVPFAVAAARALAASLGLVGIFFIMLSATRRLDRRQAARYGSSPAYVEYCRQSHALVPKLL
jgi:steroid 5-alpha reductase family enzyme